MSEFLGSIWWLLVALGLLITFHEFGHYWVARRMGVRVLKFSIGFGKKLWSRTGRDGTEYVIAAIPLGGYVKMLDEREGEVDEATWTGFQPQIGVGTYRHRRSRPGFQPDFHLAGLLVDVPGWHARIQTGRW